MKTLHRPEEAKEKEMVRMKVKEAKKATAFTPLELAAAEQLIHLSESSSSTAFTPTGGAPSSASAASASSSPRSVNAPPPPPPALVIPRGLVDDDDDDGDEQEVAGSRRRTKRYRPIAEIYAATARIGGCCHKNKKAME